MIQPDALFPVQAQAETESFVSGSHGLSTDSRVVGDAVIVRLTASICSDKP